MSKQRTYEQQEVVDLEYQGYGIAKPEGKVVFIEKVLPGEVVDVTVTRRKRDHAFATPTVWHKRSPERVEPFCEHFDDCGGCTWQYLPYAGQAAYKGRFVADVLRHLGGIAEPAPLPIISCDQDRMYRNKLEFSFAPIRWITQAEVDAGAEITDRRALGFHVKGRFDRVLDIRKCHLQADPSNAIRTAARDIAIAGDYTFHDPREHEGLLRSIIIRTTRDGEVMVILVIGEDRADLAARFIGDLMARVPEITSAHYIINATKNDDSAPHPAWHVAGTHTIQERCGHLRFAIHPKSFYQTNSAQAERLYGVVQDWAELRQSDTLLDLYCGIGSIGLLLADQVKKVVGVEYVGEAVARARENAELNGLANCEFHAGDVRAILKGVPVSGSPASAGAMHDPNSPSVPAPDVIVIDPPRAGVHPDVLEELLRIRARQIVYVSCKPSTQARDLRRLAKAYEIKSIQPVDMFPQTFHIENVVDLRLKQG